MRQGYEKNGADGKEIDNIDMYIYRGKARSESIFTNTAWLINSSGVLNKDMQYRFLQWVFKVLEK